MYLLEIHNFLRENFGSNAEVITLSELRKFKPPGKLPFALIINSDKDGNLGHWVALTINKNRHITFFDSFGYAPCKPILKFIKRAGRTHEINKMQLQRTSSTFCGMYACYFTYFLLNNGCLNDFIQIFSNNQYFNDILIRRAFLSVYFSNITNKKIRDFRALAGKGGRYKK